MSGQSPIICGMDKVERVLEQYGDSNSSPFGHHAWTASYFVHSSQMDYYVKKVEEYLRSRQDDSEPTFDVDEFIMESDVNRHIFKLHVFHMAYSL